MISGEFIIVALRALSFI